MEKAGVRTRFDVWIIGPLASPTPTAHVCQGLSMQAMLIAFPLPRSTHSGLTSQLLPSVPNAWGTNHRIAESTPVDGRE